MNLPSAAKLFWRKAVISQRLPTVFPPVCLPVPELIFVKTPSLYLLFGLATSCAGLAAVDLQTLVDRSPFSPPGLNLTNEPTVQPGTLEFRGMVVDSEGTAYSVFDVTASRGYWLREGVDGPFRVKSYNAQDSLLEIEQNGNPVKLQMKRATIQAGAPIAATPRPTNNQARPAGATGNNANRPATNADPAADARRLEAVAAEVRRRRALRNAATTGTTPPAPGAQPSQ